MLEGIVTFIINKGKIINKENWLITSKSRWVVIVLFQHCSQENENYTIWFWALGLFSLVTFLFTVINTSAYLLLLWHGLTLQDRSPQGFPEERMHLPVYICLTPGLTPYLPWLTILSRSACYSRQTMTDAERKQLIHCHRVWNLLITCSKSYWNSS